MFGSFRNVGPSLQRSLLVLAGLHLGANLLRQVVRHLVFEDIMVFILLLALVGMCVGAIMGLASRKCHAFAAALFAHGFIALDARYLHCSPVSVGEVVGGIAPSMPVDIVAFPILLFGWCALLATQLGLINLIARGLSRGWETPIWGARRPEARIFVLPDQRRSTGSRSA